MTGSIAEPDGPLLIEGRTGPVVLSGRRCRVYGTAENGVQLAVVDGHELLEDLRVAGGPPDGAIRAPFMIERRWSEHPRCTERCFVPPDVPGLVVEWRADEPEPRPLVLSWHIPDVARWRIVGACLHTRSTAGRRRAYDLKGGSIQSVEMDAEGIAVEARLSLAGGKGARLSAYVRDSEPAARARTRRALRDVRPTQARASSELLAAAEEDLTIRGATQVIADALPWAVSRLTTLLPSGSSDPWALCEGDPLARSLVAAGALAVGRLPEATRLVARGPSGPRELVRRATGGFGPSGGSNRPDTDEEMIAAIDGMSGGLVALRRSSPARESRIGRYDAWLDGWRRFDRGDVEGAGRALESLAADGLRSGHAWRLPDDVREDASLTALLPATLVFGALGARFDAAVGRLRMAPRFPVAWSSVTVRNVCLGRSRVSLAYTRDSHEDHRFVLSQTAGAVPINLVFEPTVAGAGVREVRIDGSRAELEASTLPGRVGIRLQLPLDQPRRVVIIADS